MGRMNIQEARKMVAQYREAKDHDVAYMIMLDMMRAIENALPDPEIMDSIKEGMVNSPTTDWTAVQHLENWSEGIKQLSLGSDEEFVVYSQGVLCCSICTSLDIWDVPARMNAVHPSGTKHGWKISDDKTFSDGVNPNPCPCDKNPMTHRHFLMEC